MEGLLKILPPSQQAILWLIGRASQLTDILLMTDDVAQALWESSLSQSLFPTGHTPFASLTQVVIIATTFLRQPQANCLSRDLRELKLTDIGQMTAQQIKSDKSWEEVARKISTCARDRQNRTEKSKKLTNPRRSTV